MFDASDFDKQRIDAIVGIVSERLVRRKTIFNVSTESVEKLELTKFKPYMMSKAFFRGRICDIDKENRCFVKINIHGEDGDYGY